MKRFGLATIAIGAMLAAACNGNGRDATNDNVDNTVGTAGVADNNRVSSGDEAFVKDMLMDGMAEIDLGKMAKERAQSAEVKQFGDRMIREHTKAGNHLEQIAGTYSITPPSQVDPEHHELMTRLSQLKGADFDREYINAMVDGHEHVVNELQKHASQDRFGDNKGAVTPEPSNTPSEASVNQWAAMTLPTVREHLTMAKQIQDHLKNRNTTN